MCAEMVVKGVGKWAQRQWSKVSGEGAQKRWSKVWGEGAQSWWSKVGVSVRRDGGQRLR